MSNVEVRYSVYFKKRLSKAKPPFDILRFAVPTGCQNGQINHQKTVPFWCSFI